MYHRHERLAVQPTSSSRNRHPEPYSRHRARPANLRASAPVPGLRGHQLGRPRIAVVRGASEKVEQLLTDELHDGNASPGLRCGP